RLNAYESWLAELVGEKKVFSPSITDFLISFPSHPKAKKLYRSKHLFSFCLNVTHNDLLRVQQFSDVTVIPPNDTDDSAEGEFRLGPDRQPTLDESDKSNDHDSDTKHPILKKVTQALALGSQTKHANGDEKRSASAPAPPVGVLNGQSDNVSNDTNTATTKQQKHSQERESGGAIEMTNRSYLPNLLEVPSRDPNATTHNADGGHAASEDITIDRTNRPIWTTLTFDSFFKEAKLKNKGNRNKRGPDGKNVKYLQSWMNHCEAVDPLWKKLRMLGRKTNDPQFMQNHITLWAFDINKGKPTVMDDKSLKQLSKILAAYVMRYVLSKTALQDESNSENDNENDNDNGNDNNNDDDDDDHDHDDRIQPIHDDNNNNNNNNNDGDNARLYIDGDNEEKKNEKYNSSEKR
ncbi:hypothetical protein RFI_00027, partial [Reticulomyxa filosa]